MGVFFMRHLGKKEFIMWLSFGTQGGEKRRAMGRDYRQQ
jgi:hypothetical protein